MVTGINKISLLIKYGKWLRSEGKWEGQGQRQGQRRKRKRKRQRQGHAQRTDLVGLPDLLCGAIGCFQVYSLQFYCFIPSGILGNQCPCEEANKSMKMQQIGIGLQGLPGSDCMTCMSFETMFIGSVEVQEVAKAVGSLSSSQVFVDSYKPGLALLEHEISLLLRTCTMEKMMVTASAPKWPTMRRKKRVPLWSRLDCLAFFQWYCKILSAVVVEIED